MALQNERDFSDNLIPRHFGIISQVSRTRFQRSSLIRFSAVISLSQTATYMGTMIQVWTVRTKETRIELELWLISNEWQTLLDFRAGLSPVSKQSKQRQRVASRWSTEGKRNGRTLNPRRRGEAQWRSDVPWSILNELPHRKNVHTRLVACLRLNARKRPYQIATFAFAFERACASAYCFRKRPVLRMVIP